jgi:hypothetical protein
MYRLVGALCAVALASFPRAAAAQVIPLADCVTRGSDSSRLQAWFGYRNSGSTVVVPVGTENFFVPPPLDRGQPAAFEPGEFHRVFSVEFPSDSFVTWTLSSVQAPADRTLPSCDLPLTWVGPWDATLTYETNQIVSYLGSSWIALRRNSAQPPDAGADWNLLAQKGETGAQGERGERGETGAEGPQGIQGPRGADGAPGFSPAFPASAIFVVPATGRLAISDPNVKADSVVIAAYVGGSLLPPAVAHIDDGQITILALPGRRIRYVVFK